MRFPIAFFATIALLVFYTFLCVNRLYPGYAWADALGSIGVLAFVIRTQIFHRHLPHESLSARIATWISSYALGVWSSFVLLCLILDCASLFFIVTQLVAPDSLSGVDREAWLTQGIRISFYASFATCALGLLQALYGPVVKRVTVPIAGLPIELSGLTIAQISDLRIGISSQRLYRGNVVKRVMALSPDIIAVTGDLADGKPEALKAHTTPLAALKASLGTYFVTGNHEYYSGALPWIEALRGLGMTLLLNENRVLEHKSKHVMVAGVTDLTAAGFIPEHRTNPFAAAQTPKACDVRILLAHQPESCYEAQKAAFDLQLSGHTHGGQYFPFNLLVRAAKAPQQRLEAAIRRCGSIPMSARDSGAQPTAFWCLQKSLC